MSDTIDPTFHAGTNGADRCPTCDRADCGWHRGDHIDLGDESARDCNKHRVDWRDRCVMLEAQLAAEQSAHKVDVERLREELSKRTAAHQDDAEELGRSIEMLWSMNAQRNEALDEARRLKHQNETMCSVAKVAHDDRDRALSRVRQLECELSAAIERAERAMKERGEANLSLHREQSAHADTRRKLDEANEQIESLRGKLEAAHKVCDGVAGLDEAWADRFERQKDRAVAAEQRVSELTERCETMLALLAEALRHLHEHDHEYEHLTPVDLINRIDAALSPPATKPDATKRESLADVRRRLGFPELSREEREQHVQDNIDAATDGKDGQP